MKVAVLVSGEPRYSQIAGKFFRQNTSKHQYDIFVHSWDHCKFGFQSLDFCNWQPTSTLIHSEERMLDPIFNRIKNHNLITDSLLEIKKNNFYNLFGQVLSFYYSFDLAKDHLMNYDLVMKIRHDSALNCIDDNIDQLIEFIPYVSQLPYPNESSKSTIFTEYLNYIDGKVVIQDTVLFGQPQGFFQFATDLPSTIITICETFAQDGIKFIHHQVWSMIAEIRKVNILPMAIGRAPLYKAPDFKSVLLRPGIEDIPNPTYDQIFNTYLSWPAREAALALTPILTSINK